MYNKTIIIGRLENDPQMDEKGNARFTIWNRTVDSDGKEVACNHDIVAPSGKQATIAMEYLRKGNLVCIEGNISHYEKVIDGELKESHALVPTKIVFLSSVKKKSAEVA